MKSKTIARLSLLLPTAVGLTMSTATPAAAVEISAAGYAATISRALQSGDQVTVLRATENLRACGVSSFSSGDGEVSLDNIEALAAQGPTSGVIPSGSVFSVPAGLTASVSCPPNVVLLSLNDDEAGVEFASSV